MTIQRSAAAALLACASAAQAVTIFSDTFNTDTLGENVVVFVGGWTVSDGTVDVLGPGFFDLAPGSGRYIDLDGSNRDAGVFTKTLSLTAGTPYSATFSLAGSQRNFIEIVDVSFGTSSATYTLAPTDPFALRTLSFTPATTGVFSLRFANRGGDLEGALLDNVTVASVPEPGMSSLLLGGLGVIGFIARRRRQG